MRKSLYLFKKNLSYQNRDRKCDIDKANFVLPLLKINQIPIEITTTETYSYLKRHLTNYLDKAYSDEPDKKVVLLGKVNNYFLDIQNNRLYEDKKDNQVVQILLKRLASFMLKYQSDPSINLEEIIQSLFTAINERACIDDHQNNLKGILIHISYFNEEAPIRKILQYLQVKMEEQIRLQLLSLDKNVFKGFWDRQTTHEIHIAKIILDKIFNIADGEYQSNKDILIPDTTFGSQVLKNLFEGKLTLQHLLSELDSGWRECFAMNLSCSTSSIGPIHISAYDLKKSPKFVAYLAKKNNFTEAQVEILLNIDAVENDDDLNFLKPLATINTDIGQESWIYTPLFAEQLVDYLREKNEKSFSEKPLTPITKKEKSTPELIPENIQKKLMKLIATPEKSEKFSYEEIETAMQNQNSEYHQPFLKAYLHPIHLMITYCKAEDAMKVYTKWIVPNSKMLWAQDCLIMMCSVNMNAIHKIGINILNNSLFKATNGELLLIQRIALETPNLLNEWLEKKIISINFLNQLPDNIENSALHYLAHYHPSILKEWTDKDYIEINELLLTRNKKGHCIAHILSQFGIELIEKWLEQGQISMEKLLEIRSKEKISILHILAEHHSDILDKWFRSEKITFKTFMQIRDQYNNSALFWLAKFKPEILYDWVKDGLINLQELLKLEETENFTLVSQIIVKNIEIIKQWMLEGKLKMKDLLGKNPAKNFNIIRTIISSAPDFLIWLVDKNYVTVQQLQQKKLLHKTTVCHILASKKVSILEHWVECKATTLDKFLYDKNDNGQTIAHFLIEQNPTSLQKWIDKELLSPKKIKNLKANDGHPLLIWASQYAIELINDWITKGFITIKELLKVKDGFGNPIIFWLTRFSADQLNEWIDNDTLHVKDFINQKNSDGQNISSFIENQLLITPDQRSLLERIKTTPP